MSACKTTRETARLWKCSERKVQLLCKRGMIPGAGKVSGIWLIPEEAVLGRIPPSEPPFRAEQLYGRNTEVHLSSALPEARERGCTVTQYPILEGITLVFQDIHEEHLDYGAQTPQLPPELIAIQHCREGRFEGEYPDGECIYMGPGSLSVNLPAWAPVTNRFPLRHYHGFYIAIVPDIAEASIEQLEQLLGPLRMDFSVLLEQLSPKNRLAFYGAEAETDRLIAAIYDAYGQGRGEQLGLPVLGLLQQLCTRQAYLPGPEQYFPRDQVAAIKEIRQYLISHLNTHIPLPELADRFHLSLTGMKTCFKAVYGLSIGKYLREFRMQAAAEMLRTTDLRIIEISAALGYENPSKFSEAFAACHGITPSKYRKTFVRQEQSQPPKG